MRILSTQPELRQCIKLMRGKVKNHRPCNMTQAQVAKKAGLGVKVIEKAESSTFDLTLNDLASILSVHGMRVALLIDKQPVN